MSLLAINQKLIKDSRISDLIDINPLDRDMLVFFNEMSLNSNNFGLMPRSGINNLPFKTTLISHLHMTIPDISDSVKTWEEISDQRAIYFESLVIGGKTLIVEWSGGIDSTLIVVAILRNWNTRNFDKCLIACNWSSIIENPIFYHNHVRPNFNMIDINDITQFLSNDQNYVSVGGAAADVLLMSMPPGFDQQMALRNPHLLNSTWKHDPDTLINYINTVTKNEKFGPWFINLGIESIQSRELDLPTYFDILWWIGFNYNWHSQLTSEWLNFRHDQSTSWQDYIQQNMSWYEYDDYQIWSMQNNATNHKHRGSITTIKIPSKEYIYNYTRDKWYYDYKTKIISTGRVSNQSIDRRPFAVTDDWRVLYLDSHLEEIRYLLPSYLV